ncbi:enkurin [Notolabrus celidotus]|uniref:enkurin n=1 Tax=Notolabrus celidotus TaxID=1203425 RepID=UPI00148F4683|nr:enkurin [Notolabrus celidotus]
MSGFIYPPESVYNLLPREEVVTQKPPRYMSKFRSTVILENKSTKDTTRTMGPAKAEVPSPDKYLKKHSKESKQPEKARSFKEAHSCTARKPPVPARTDQPLMGLQTKRDFIKTATAVPMRPRPTCVDTSKGHKQPLENSGLLPKYIKKKDYGEVPEYLQHRNEDEKRAQEELRNFVKEQREQGAMKQLSEEERLNILEGLRKNLNVLHHDYQCLSLVIETMTKKAHKERLEAKMKQLENDISLVERFKTIYIPKK